MYPEATPTSPPLQRKSPHHRLPLPRPRDARRPLPHAPLQVPRPHPTREPAPAHPERKARMTAANTKHGNLTAPKRTQQHQVRTFVTCNRLVCAARLL